MSPLRASHSRSPSSQAGDPIGPVLVDLEVAFLRWIDGRSRCDVLQVGPPRSVTLALKQALERLRTSTVPLSPLRAHRLGLAAGVSIGVAADRLLSARLAPRGPRCRSFRSASYYLFGLARIDQDDLAVVSDPAASGAMR